jgi:hypothetical protein
VKETKDDSEKEKLSRKIRVEFDMDPEDVRELLKTGDKEPVRIISDADLSRMSEVGVIRAADYLSQAQMDEVSIAMPKFIRKTGSKVKSAISNPQIQVKVVEKVVDTIVVRSVEEDKEDRPKE